MRAKVLAQELQTQKDDHYKTSDNNNNRKDSDSRDSSKLLRKEEMRVQEEIQVSKTLLLKDANEMPICKIIQNLKKHKFQDCNKCNDKSNKLEKINNIEIGILREELCKSKDDCKELEDWQTFMT